jgi:hypothetical protein
LNEILRPRDALAIGIVGALILLGGSCERLFAQIPSWGIDEFRSPADVRWRTIAAEDIQAAFRLLRNNHPGAAPELHDLAFQQMLNRAHMVALVRAGRVSSYQGYTAVLAGFATDMGDKHIWSRPTFVINTPRWPKIIVNKRGNSWIVADVDQPQATLLGASLVSCDGEPVERVAKTILGGFRANWSVGAQQIQSAPWLLVDEGNPFITRPNVCIFDRDGEQQTVKLEWTRIKRDALLPRLQKAVGAGAAGYGVRRVGHGYWIALQDLSSDRAGNVVKAVEDQKNVLRESSFVVLDLRGNGGGSSEVGRRVAVSLLGEGWVDARLGPEVQTDCGGADGVWRASKDNIKDLEFLLHSTLQGGPEVKQIFENLLRQARTAYAQGHAFSGPIACAVAPSRQTPGVPPARLMHGRLILLTDHLCFSSCLAVTDDFRKLGAFHVGQATDAATHFIEVREQYLPSGYSVFSTLQSVDPSAPKQIGPFQPDLTFDEDIADTAALEEWVIRTVLPAIR